jgi:6-phosphofructokinase
MARKIAFYAQSGGVSAVINASACGVVQTARRHPDLIAKVYAGHNGILGALTENLIDTSVEPEAAIAAYRHTPGAAFGSCRYKLGSIEEHRAQYERLVAVFRAHEIGFFFYNGGGDSQDSAHKVGQISTSLGYPIVCVGIPKTVDNDLAITDNSPGFGSAAKYLATSLREAAFDLAAMSATSTKVFVLEVMGRHAGWTHAQLGGVAPLITNLISTKLGCKCHWAIPDYLQRSARHIASGTDIEQAYAVGRAAVEFAAAGKSGVMPAIRRLSDAPYRWDIIEAPLSEVANQEKLLPADFISADGFGITETARRYLAPLIFGDAYPPSRNGLPDYASRNGLPDYVKLQNVRVPRKLAETYVV